MDYIPKHCLYIQHSILKVGDVRIFWCKEDDKSLLSHQLEVKL